MVYEYREKLDITYDSPDNRKYYRLINAIKVIIDGNEYKTTDWSVNAFKIGGYTGNLSVGKIVLAAVEINFQGFFVKFFPQIKVLRIDAKNNTLVAEFVDLSERHSEFLVYFSKSLITGKFQPFDEVIKHIDIPITDNYITDTFQEEPESKKHFFNRSFMILLYVVLGIVIFLYGFKLYYSNVYLMQIDSAVVLNKTKVINSPTKGILSDIYVKDGESVYKGQPLFKIINPDIERKIEDKKINILKNEAVLKEKQKNLENFNFK